MSGDRKFLAHRILDLIGQRGLVHDFANFCVSQCSELTSQVWFKELPALVNKTADQRSPLFSMAAHRIVGFSAAFEQRLHATYPEKRLIQTNVLHFKNVRVNGLDLSKSHGDNINLLAVNNKRFYRFLVSTTMGATDCLFLEFTPRRLFTEHFLEFKVDEGNDKYLLLSKCGAI